MDSPLVTGIFTASFWFGAAATVASFALGLGQHGHLHLPGLSHGHFSGGHGAAPTFTPLNVNSILIFLTVFGAVGLILESGVGAVIAFLVALMAGLIAGWLVFLFVARFLARGQTFLADEPMVGTVGTVSQAIGAGRVGEIIYIRDGVRHSDGARSVDGAPISAGEEVVVVDYRRGIATVQPWRAFLDSSERRSLGAP